MKFCTKRFIFSAAGILIATALLCFGKLSGECWVYAFAVSLAGHHAEDIAKAIRGNHDSP